MRCRRARTLLALHAGGDLPEPQVQPLMEHLDCCPQCAGELKDLERALAVVGEIAGADGPKPLPADFAQKVRRAAQRRPIRSTRRGSGIWPRWRPVWGLAAATVAVVVLLAVFLGRSPQPPGDLVRLDPEASPTGSEAGRSPGVQWRDLRGSLPGCLKGPYRIDSWDVPDQPGVFAILHKPDPENRPDTFVVDYCGEGRNLAAGRGYPWLRQRARRLLARAGSAENLYVAVCLMADSDRGDRREVQKTLIRQFSPFFNQRGGV